MSAGINPANIEKAKNLIKQELERYVDTGVTSDELSDSQANFVGRLPLSLESNGGVAGSLLNIERFDLGLDYYRQYPDMVQEVTVEDVLETARKYIPLNAERLVIATLVIATAGP